MAAKTYHELLYGMLAALLGYCLAGWAWAGQLRVDGMRLDHDDTWQRGDVQEETELDSYILSQADEQGILRLYVARRATPLRAETRLFHEQMTAKWRALYGGAALITPRVMAGHDWLTCRRPGRDGKSTVFHWVTAEAGQVYSLIWFGDGERVSLPASALELLGGVGFDADKPAPEQPPPAPVADPPAAEASQPPAEPRPNLPAVAPPAVASPTTEVQVPVAPAPAPMAQAEPPDPADPVVLVDETPRPATPIEAQAPTDSPVFTPWRLARTVVARPGRNAVENLAQLDANRLAKGDTLTGYGLEGGEGDLAWFLEGFRWVSPKPGARERKVRFRLGWRVAWDAAPETLTGQATHPMRLRFQTLGREGEVAESTRQPFQLRFQWLELCADRGHRLRAYASLERGQHAPLERLLRMRHPACPEPAAQPLPAPVTVTVGEDEGAAETLDKTLDLPLPLPRPLPLPVPMADAQRVLVLAVRFSASASEDLPGDGLLRQAGVYYLYVPET